MAAGALFSFSLPPHTHIHTDSRAHTHTHTHTSSSLPYVSFHSLPTTRFGLCVASMLSSVRAAEIVPRRWALSFG